MRLYLLCALIAPLIACSTKESTPKDADSGPAPDSGPKPIAARPATPRLTDWQCPEGWTSERVQLGTDLEQAVCRPPQRVACEAGARQRLGDDACSTLGTRCPAGSDFVPADLLGTLAAGFEGKRIYVRPGAVGEGTASKPLGAIADALSRAVAGDVILLSKGTHKGEVPINKRVAIVGSCVAGTTIEPPTASEKAGTVSFLPGCGGARVTNLRITGPRPGLWVSTSGAEIALESLEIVKAQGFGILFTVSTIAKLHDVVVRDTESKLSNGHAGRALSVQEGSQVTLDEAVLINNRESSVAVLGSGSSVEMTDVVVDGTESRETEGDLGDGLTVLGGTATVKRAWFSGARATGIGVSEPGAVVTLVDVVVEGTRGQESSGEEGYGLAAPTAAASAARGCFLPTTAGSASPPTRRR